MSKEMYGPEGILEIIEMEGFHYGLTEYLSLDRIAPEELRSLVMDYLYAKEKIETYLEPYKR